VRDADVLSLLSDAADAVALATTELRGHGLSGTRPSQYVADVAADAAAIDVLRSGGLQVLSEESGRTGEDGPICVLDPIDGSTNFDRGIPYYSTSLCVLDDAGPWCALVRNHATGTTYEASRGGGARRDGVAISVSSVTALRDAVVAFSGLPGEHGGWLQYRALGAASLELCGVAEGSLDCYAAVRASYLHPWDYLGGLLIIEEAGGVMRDLDGAALVEAADVRRHPVAAASSSLCDELAALARTWRQVEQP
jgi:fructose-1,6-bisphosphatase/inositol monophosphatase family enzyme